MGVDCGNWEITPLCYIDLNLTENKTMRKIPTPKEIEIVGKESPDRPLLRYLKRSLGLSVAMLAATAGVGCTVDAKNDSYKRPPFSSTSVNNATITCRTANGEVYLEDKTQDRIYHSDAGTLVYTSKITSERFMVPVAQCVVRDKNTP